MQHNDIKALQKQHAAWALLNAQHAPLILSFLGEFFINQNHGATPASTVIDALDDHLYILRSDDDQTYPRSAAEYLDDWADDQRGWLRKFHPFDADEPYFEATSAVEKAYRWVESLQARDFVGTESRLHTLIDLLRQIVHGSELDPQARIAELKRRRDAIDTEIDNVENDRFTLMDATAMRDRYQLFSSTARELLSDFREVEENFRALDRAARESITGWDGSKGELLADLVGDRQSIATSDQGRSFEAFYDFLLSESRQTELAELTEAVWQMPALNADRRLRSIHHEWAEAAERTQRTVRNLSEQLRRFLEDRVWLENRRVVDLVRTVEQTALQLRESPVPETLGLEIDTPGLPIHLPMERPLYNFQVAAPVDSLVTPAAVTDEVDYSALLNQRFVDTARLRQNIFSLVPPESRAELAEIIAFHPVEEGLAEILGYLALSDEDITIEFMEDSEITIEYTDAAGTIRALRLPQVWVHRT